MQILGLGSEPSIWPSNRPAELEELLLHNARGGLVIVTAGDTALGRFDDLSSVAAICRRHECWLHVDAAIGLPATLSPRLRQLLRGLEFADSVSADAHKWLNVPYECGLFFSAHAQYLEAAFGMPEADYLPGITSFRGYSVLGPESSRRARSLAVWATLAAYGREGLQKIVERLEDARTYLLEKLALDGRFVVYRVPSVAIACFRLRPGKSPALDGDEANLRLLSSLRRQAKFAVGRTRIDGHLTVRLALVNWRITQGVIDEFLQHLELTIKEDCGLDYS